MPETCRAVLEAKGALGLADHEVPGGPDGVATSPLVRLYPSFAPPSD